MNKKELELRLKNADNIIRLQERQIDELYRLIRQAMENVNDAEINIYLITLRRIIEIKKD